MEKTPANLLAVRTFNHSYQNTFTSMAGLAGHNSIQLTVAQRSLVNEKISGNMRSKWSMLFGPEGDNHIVSKRVYSFWPKGANLFGFSTWQSIEPFLLIKKIPDQKVL